MKSYVNDLVAMVLTSADFEPRLVVTRTVRLGVPATKSSARGRRTRNKTMYFELKSQSVQLSKFYGVSFK